MKVIKKVNNNTAIAIDSNGQELVILGNGVGFPAVPYELNDFSKIRRTFYDVEERYIKIFNDINPEVFEFISSLVDAVKKKLNRDFSSSLTFIIADHINFALNRYHSGNYSSIEYSFDLEYEYPEFTKASMWMLKKINEHYNVKLGKGEITSLTIHLYNSVNYDDEKTNHLDFLIQKTIKDIREIIESELSITIDRESFNYFRLKNHIKYFVQRKYSKNQSSDDTGQLLDDMKKRYPEIYECVLKIEEYLKETFDDTSTNSELLYLMINISRIYYSEDCYRKSITPE